MRSIPWILLALAGLVGTAPADGTPPPKLSAPEHLRLIVPTRSEKPEDLLDPAAKGWETARPLAVLLSRTPRVYQTEPTADRPPPALEVRAARAGGKLVVRLRWADATADAPQAPPAKKGAEGEPTQIYHRPTAETSTFADAAAVMSPAEWSGPAFPSLQMGDAKHPVRIDYWNAGRGAEHLTATGRATPTPAPAASAAEATFPHRAAHADGHWTLTAVLPDRPDGHPLAFAVWDGGHQDRDGLKFFSVWYVLTPQ